MFNPRKLFFKCRLLWHSGIRSINIQKINHKLGINWISTFKKSIKKLICKIFITVMKNTRNHKYIQINTNSRIFQIRCGCFFLVSQGQNFTQQHSPQKNILIKSFKKTNYTRWYLQKLDLNKIDFLFKNWIYLLNKTNRTSLNKFNWVYEITHPIRANQFRPHSPKLKHLKNNKNYLNFNIRFIN